VILDYSVEVPIQAVFLRFSNCNFVLPAFQAGGSLAGNDSMEASSTMSSISS